MGIEPTTYSLGSCRSTTELRPRGHQHSHAAIRRKGLQRMGRRQAVGIRVKRSELCYYRPNCLRNSVFACSSVRRRLAGKFLPARLI